MVLLAGIELVAASYIVHRRNKKKEKERGEGHDDHDSDHEGHSDAHRPPPSPRSRERQPQYPPSPNHQRGQTCPPQPQSRTHLQVQAPTRPPPGPPIDSEKARLQAAYAAQDSQRRQSYSDHVANGTPPEQRYRRSTVTSSTAFNSQPPIADGRPQPSQPYFSSYPYYTPSGSSSNYRPNTGLSDGPRVSSPISPISPTPMSVPRRPVPQVAPPQPVAQPQYPDEPPPPYRP